MAVREPAALCTSEAKGVGACIHLTGHRADENERETAECWLRSKLHGSNDLVPAAQQRACQAHMLWPR